MTTPSEIHQYHLQRQNLIKANVLSDEEANLNKAFNQGCELLFEKGKKLPVGTIRTHGGHKRIKTPQGWRPYREGGKHQAHADEAAKDKRSEPIVGSASRKQSIEEDNKQRKQDWRDKNVDKEEEARNKKAGGADSVKARKGEKLGRELYNIQDQDGTNVAIKFTDGTKFNGTAREARKTAFDKPHSVHIDMLKINANSNEKVEEEYQTILEKIVDAQLNNDFRTPSKNINALRKLGKKLGKTSDQVDRETRNVLRDMKANLKDQREADRKLAKEILNPKKKETKFKKQSQKDFKSKVNLLQQAHSMGMDSVVDAIKKDLEQYGEIPEELTDNAMLSELDDSDIDSIFEAEYGSNSKSFSEKDFKKLQKNIHQKTTDYRLSLSVKSALKKNDMESAKDWANMMTYENKNQFNLYIDSLK